MTRTYILTLILLLSVSSSIGKGIYIHPRVGAGYFGQRHPIATPNYSGKLAVAGGVYAGYSFKNFRIGTGVSLMTTRYTAKGLITQAQFAPTTGLPVSNPDRFDLTVTDTRFIIPVTVGYIFMPEQKISIIPELSIGPGFDAASRARYESTTTGQIGKSKGSGGPVAAMGQIAVHCLYKINNKMHFSLSPSYTHELNSILNGNTVPGGIPIGRYIITGDVGVLIAF